MRPLIVPIVGFCLLAITSAYAPPAIATTTTNSTRSNLQAPQDIGRETLPPNDGWASLSTGTTGGSAATLDHVYTVTKWNRFTDHDKVMLIGSSDTSTLDPGKLRVTVHHNLFANTGQRTPRVRFGQVHVYNNYYDISNPNTYVYSWGVGVQSKIYAENNFFRSAGVTPDQFIRRFNGTAIHAAGTLVNGQTPKYFVDVLAAYNAANDPDLSGDVGWTPTRHTDINAPQAVPGLVAHAAGPFHDDE